MSARRFTFERTLVTKQTAFCKQSLIVRLYWDFFWSQASPETPHNPPNLFTVFAFSSSSNQGNRLAGGFSGHLGQGLLAFVFLMHQGSTFYAPFTLMFPHYPQLPPSTPLSHLSVSLSLSIYISSYLSQET